MTSGETVETIFQTTFGRRPASLWQAPGRVNLIGEHTDYNDGFALPFAIDRCATVALAPRDDRCIRLTSSFTTGSVSTTLDDVADGQLAGWSAYLLGVAWAFGRARTDLRLVNGFDLAVHSEVPTGAGLSSSAAVEMATAIALNSLWFSGYSRMELAQLGQRTENAVVGAPTGVMDQAASMFGQQDAAVFLDCRSLEVEPVDLAFHAADLAVLVVNSRVAHAHATGGYAQRRTTCQRAAAQLGVAALRDLTPQDLPRAAQQLDNEAWRRVRHVVTENQRVLAAVEAIRGHDLTALGQLMNESHASLRDDFEVSVPELDAIVATAQSTGALGARMTGGGFGGSAIVLAPTRTLKTIAARINAVFDQHGWRPPESFEVRPSHGAQKVTAKTVRA